MQRQLVIISSPFSRTVQTADIVAGTLEGSSCSISHRVSCTCPLCLVQATLEAVSALPIHPHQHPCLQPALPAPAKHSCLAMMHSMVLSVALTDRRC